MSEKKMNDLRLIQGFLLHLTMLLRDPKDCVFFQNLVMTPWFALLSTAERHYKNIFFTKLKMGWTGV